VFWRIYFGSLYQNKKEAAAFESAVIDYFVYCVKREPVVVFLVFEILGVEVEQLLVKKKIGHLLKNDKIPCIRAMSRKLKLPEPGLIRHRTKIKWECKR